MSYLLLRHRFDPAEARRPEACLTCHSGPPHPDDDALFNSAHGQRYQKEGRGWDWSKPLAKNNYPVPTYAYCHMREGNHQVADKAVWKFGIREVNPKTAENAIKRKRWLETCADCHPPETARRFFQELDAHPDVRDTLGRMRDDHLRNIRLGVGHQSPDHQWWHGHPALDGDLLRIKSLAKGEAPSGSQR